MSIDAALPCRVRVASWLWLLASCAAYDPGRDGSGSEDWTATAAEASAHSRRGQQPNIILLLADDAGFADFGFQPHGAADLAEVTPRLNAFAQEGARFDAFYMASPICSPSRAAIMTGREPARIGHEDNIPHGYLNGGLPLELPTVADRLRARGYATGLVGKWHLGYPVAYQPLERGFDHFFGLLQGSRMYGPMLRPGQHRSLLDGRTPMPEGGYLTDRLGAAAVRFIERSRHRPFFLFLSFTAPHTPLQPRPEDVDRFAHLGPERGAYAGLLKAMDDNVGHVLDALDRLDLADNTLVLFTSDNGGHFTHGSNNAPLRGRKGLLYEGGVRVPAIVRWPGHVEPGRVIDSPTSALDLAPTFASLAGEILEDGAQQDGLDLVALLEGGVEALPERALFWRRQGRTGPIAMRQGRWKLVWDRPAGLAPELFDLEEDDAEANDLAPAQPERVATMRKRLEAWEEQTIEPLWDNRRGSPDRPVEERRGPGRPR